MKFVRGNLSAVAPVYVTNKTADGMTGSYSISIWQSLLALLIVWTNVVLWGGYGIAKFFITVF